MEMGRVMSARPGPDVTDTGSSSRSETLERYLTNRDVADRRQRASAASEPRERSAPAKRRARERVGESEGRSPSDKTKAISSTRSDPVSAAR